MSVYIDIYIQYNYNHNKIANWVVGDNNKHYNFLVCNVMHGLF